MSKENDVVPPRASDPPTAIAVTAAAGWQATPAAWYNKWVRFKALGATVYIRFSATSTPAVTTATAWPIADGAYEDFYVKGREFDAFIHHIASGNGSLRCLVVSP